jgi:hypothetical protein
MKVKLLDHRPHSGEYTERWYDAVGDCINVLFEDDEYNDWLGVFGSGGVGSLRRALIFPTTSTALIIAGGHGYVVNGNTGVLSYRMDCDAWQDVVIVPGHDLIMGCDFTKLYGVTSNGLQWKSDRVALDGILLKEVTPDYLIGQALQVRHSYSYSDFVWIDFKLVFDGWVFTES